MLAMNLGSPFEEAIDKQREEINALKLKTAQSLKTVLQRMTSGLGSILPDFFGYVSTTEALNAMNTAKAYIVDDLDLQFNRAACKTEINTGSFGVVWKDCDPKYSQFRVSWAAFVIEFLRWYDNNVDFGSRFLDPNHIYDQAREYVERANDWKKAWLGAGAAVVGPDTRVQGRHNPVGNTLDGLITFAKWAGAIAVVAIVAPPVVRAVGDIMERRRAKA